VERAFVRLGTRVALREGVTISSCTTPNANRLDYLRAGDPNANRRDYRQPPRDPKEDFVANPGNVQGNPGLQQFQNLQNVQGVQGQGLGCDCFERNRSINPTMNPNLANRVPNRPGRELGALNPANRANPANPADAANPTGNPNDRQIVDRLNRHLGGRFRGQGQAFVNAARRHGIDPALLASIAMHETGNGTSRGVRNNNNPGGLMDPRTRWRTQQRFGSLDQGIDAMARNLRRNYIDRGLTTIPQIGRRYAPIGAANDPNSLNRHWVPNITNLYRRLSAP
jgi:hypothetical protein